MNSRIDRHSPTICDAPSVQPHSAVDYMVHGLVMFDASERIVVCNRRFIELSGLSPDFVRPGRTLREVLQARQARGRFSQDIEEYRRNLLADLRNGRSKSIVIDTQDGHSYRVISVPTGDGGWVATHDDVTDKVRAERLHAEQQRQLNAALTNMSQGLCMFDAEQRLIVCNKRYADVYGLTEAQTRPGTTLRQILQYRIAVGSAPLDHNGYVKDRIAEVSRKEPYQITNKLADGRSVHVVHRPTADGGWVATHEDITEAVKREATFRLLFEDNPVPMWVSHRDTLQFLAVNNAAVLHYGYSREQFLGMTVPLLRPVEDRGQFAQFMRGLSEQELTRNVGQHVKADGTVIDISICSQALTYGGADARLAAIHDITQAKQVENELRQTQKYLDTVIDHVPLPIAVRDVTGMDTDTRDGRFTLFNRAFEELTADSRTLLVGKTPHELFPKERADLIVDADNETVHSSQAVLVHEHSIVASTKEQRLVTAKKVAVRDDDGKARYLLTVLEDVTEQRQTAKDIWNLAHHDSLTGLPNRATFMDHFATTLDQASRAGEHFVLLCLDLDRFKEANDVYGHLIGDGLLRQAARRLQAATEGAFLARVGGDEFIAIVTGGPQPETAKAVIQRILAAFRDDFEIEGHRLQLGLSIGGAIFPKDGADENTLMANADAALYQAKGELRGSARFFEARLGAQRRDRRDLQNDLQTAVGRGELFLHYQPQQAIKSGKTIGFEALARWRCPKRGLVSPAVFIPLAEESSLIIQLGEWILREACREAASWKRPFKVAVNISPMQFRHGDLPRLVHSVLLETGLAPQRLELEITEGVMIDDFSRAVSILHKIKSLGVMIALDDFGSGYSSLSYLHAFPFDLIKIDRAFISDLETNHHSKAIVGAVLQLGRSLKVPTLAEGVETEEQRRFLAKEKCDAVQGYLTGRPQPIENYGDLVGRDGIDQRGHSAAQPSEHGAAKHRKRAAGAR